MRRSAQSAQLLSSRTGVSSCLPVAREAGARVEIEARVGGSWRVVEWQPRRVGVRRGGVYGQVRPDGETCDGRKRRCPTPAQVVRLSCGNEQN